MKSSIQRVAISSLWGIMVAAGGCKGATSDGMRASAGDASPMVTGSDPLQPASAPPIVSLTEKRIVGIALAIHAAEIALAKLAQERALDDRAKDYATAIVHTHEVAKSELDARALESETGPVSHGFDDELAVRAKTLSTKSGRSFDMAYVTAQIAMQTATIGLLDAILVSNYTRPEVHGVLSDMRVQAASDLREAARIQAEFAEIAGIYDPSSNGP